MRGIAIVTVIPLLATMTIALTTPKEAFAPLGIKFAAAPVAITGDNVYVAWWANTTDNNNEEVNFRASTDGHPVLRPGSTCRQGLHQPHDHPGAVRPRPVSPTADVRGQHRQPPSRFHHRQPALQRQGTDDAVRAAGLAGTPHPDHHSALRQDHPEHAVQGLHRRRIFRPQRPHL